VNGNGRSAPSRIDIRWREPPDDRRDTELRGEPLEPRRDRLVRPGQGDPGPGNGRVRRDQRPVGGVAAV